MQSSRLHRLRAPAWCLLLTLGLQETCLASPAAASPSSQPAEARRDPLRRVDGILGGLGAAPSAPKRVHFAPDPVNLSNGNLYLPFRDLHIRAYRLPLTIDRAYNSRSTEDGVFGFGWSFTYGIRIRADAGGLSVLEGDGSARQYRSSSAGFEPTVGPYSYNRELVFRRHESRRSKMKQLLFVVVSAVLAASVSAFAADQPAGAGQSEEMKKHMEEGTKGVTPEALSEKQKAELKQKRMKEHMEEGTRGVTPEPMRPSQMEAMRKHNDEMEAHLKDMQALMDKMHATKDPQERRKLMEQHQKDMQEMMKMMHSTSDEMKMGMMSGGPRSGKPNPKGEKQRQHLLEKRIDMMNMMMEQMMMHDEMMRSAPGQ